MFGNNRIVKIPALETWFVKEICVSPKFLAPVKYYCQRGISPNTVANY